jgi:hypothetical protein
MPAKPSAAKILLNEGISPDIIARSCGLSVEQVRDLMN